MAAATLTAQVTSGANITSLATTAQPVIANTGEIVFVSQGLVNVEIFTVSSPVAVNDVVVNVTSQIAAQTHLIGENVAPKYTLSAVGRTLSPVQTPKTKRL